MDPNPSLRKLGFAASDRLVIIHLDDLGMCRSTVDAWEQLMDAGTISSAAMMAPCPWFSYAAARTHDRTAANPGSRGGPDLGVHATLNCEWNGYRWAPVSAHSPDSGLVADDGRMPKTAEEVQANATPEAVAAEIRAQVNVAVASGIEPTHLDTHMGTVAHPKFIEAYVGIAVERGLPPMIPRLDAAGWRRVVRTNTGANLDEEGIGQAVQMVSQLEENGVPLLDGLAGMSLQEHLDDRVGAAITALDGLSPGVTHFIIHASADTPELRSITPDWPFRVSDLTAFSSREMRSFLKDSDLHLIGYRPFRDMMRASLTAG